MYDEFIIKNDISKIIKESSGISNSIPQISDEGMYDFFDNFDDYKRELHPYGTQYNMDGSNVDLCFEVKDQKTQYSI